MGSGVYRELFASRAIPHADARVYRAGRPRTKTRLPIWCAAGERRRQLVIRASACRTMRYLLREPLASPPHVTGSTAIPAAARHSGTAPQHDGVDLTVATMRARHC